LDASQTAPASRKGSGWAGLILAALAVTLAGGLGVILLNSGPTMLQDAAVARGYDDQTGPTGAGTVFGPQDNPLHCVVTVARADKGTRVEIVWIALEAGGQQNYTLLDRNLVLDGHQSTVDAYLSLKDPWPPGSYKIDIRLDGQLARTLFFTIAGTVRTGAGAYLLHSF
jgi:hypothetical protein